MELARVKGSIGVVNVVAVLALALTAVVSLAARKAAVALAIIFAKLQMCKYFATVSRQSQSRSTSEYCEFSGATINSWNTITSHNTIHTVILLSWLIAFDCQHFYHCQQLYVAIINGLIK